MSISTKDKPPLPEDRPATIKDLRSRELFKGVPLWVIKELMRLGGTSVSALESGQVLDLRKRGVEYMYVIVSGYLEVRLYSGLIKKGESFLLAFRGPEQVIGEMRAIAAGGPGTALIRAKERCELIKIPSRALARVAKMDWRIYRNIAELLIKKTYHERKRIEVVHMPGGQAQVAQALLNFLTERGAERVDRDGMKIKGEIQQQDIADYVGRDRCTVSRPMNALKKRGYIDYPDRGSNANKSVKILDESALKEIAETVIKSKRR